MKPSNLTTDERVCPPVSCPVFWAWGLRVQMNSDLKPDKTGFLPLQELKNVGLRSRRLHRVVFLYQVFQLSRVDASLANSNLRLALLNIERFYFISRYQP